MHTRPNQRLAGWTSDVFTLTDGAYAGIYFAWGVLQGVMTSALGALLSFAFARASADFHAKAMAGVFRAPMGFFDTTPLGMILRSGLFSLVYI